MNNYRGDVTVSFDRADLHGRLDALRGSGRIMALGMREGETELPLHYFLRGGETVAQREALAVEAS